MRRPWHNPDWWTGVVVCVAVGATLGSAVTYFSIDRYPSYPIVIEAPLGSQAEAFWKARTDVYKTCLARGNSTSSCASSADTVVKR